MSKKLKKVISILLVYLPLAYVFFIKDGFCDEIFSWRFCRNSMLENRVLLFIVAPVIVSVLYLMWSGDTKKQINNQSNKKLKPKNKQKMIPFSVAVKNFWIKMFDIEGVATRSEFWFAVLFNTIINIPTNIIFKNILQNFGFLPFIVIALMYFIVFCIPSITLSVRRLHDIGCSGWWVMVQFVLLFLAIVRAEQKFGDFFAISWFIFAIINLILFCFPSKLKNNKYNINYTMGNL